MAGRAQKLSHLIPCTDKYGYEAQKRVFISICSEIMPFIVSDNKKFHLITLKLYNY